MATDVKQLKETLEKSKVFKDWSSDNPDFYLVHLFLMSGHDPQLGYYNKKLDKIATFDVGKTIIANGAFDVFKESGTVKALDTCKVHITQGDAMIAALHLAGEKYKNQEIDKSICVLQHIKDKLVYNITLITKSFSMINIRIDAASKAVVSHELRSIMDLTSDYS